MITATIRNNGFRVEGHAHMAPTGQDVVCAGVSALVGAIYNTIPLQILEKSDGVFDANCFDVPQADVCLLMLKGGLLNIQQQYPDYLRVVSSTWN